jgi:polyisoprenoid-binding protein YceI
VSDLMTDTSSSPPASGVPPGRWTLDPERSRAAFAVKHFWGLRTVRGRFNGVTGELAVDPAGSVAGQLRINAGTVDTANKRRDKHLRSADFFAADEHAEIVFTPTALRRVGDSALEPGARLELDGTLGIAGHDERLTLELELTQTAPDLAFTTTTTVDRRKFGMTWRPMGIAHNDATLTVEVYLEPVAGRG